jgi:hypothetical protein
MDQQDKATAKPVEPTTSPGKMRLMVTWLGTEGTKQWNGLTFEPGVAQSVEHLSPIVWDGMRRAIDAGAGWKYEYLVEHALEPTPQAKAEPKTEKK